MPAIIFFRDHLMQIVCPLAIMADTTLVENNFIRPWSENIPIFVSKSGNKSYWYGQLTDAQSAIIFFPDMAPWQRRVRGQQQVERGIRGWQCHCWPCCFPPTEEGQCPSCQVIPGSNKEKQVPTVTDGQLTETSFIRPNDLRLQNHRGRC